MKAIISLVALSLATIVAATKDHYEPPPPAYTPPSYEVVTTTQVYVTTTSLCPVTETHTEGGKTYTKTYTTTSTIVKQVPTTIYQTVKQPDKTTDVVTWAYQTSTTYCPVTVVKTISGTPVTVVHTSTSLVVEKIPTTIVKTHVVETTQYLTSGTVSSYFSFATGLY